MTESVALASIDCRNVGFRNAPEAIAVGTRRFRGHMESVGDSPVAPREQFVNKTVSSAVCAAGS
jgi:hypothetical protein